MTIVEFEDRTPRVAREAWIAPTAVLIGDVIVEDEASIWFGAVLRGDFGQIHIGRGTCVQDNAVIHSSEGLPTIVGDNVTVGHLAVLEGCEIGIGALVGMGSIVMQGARIGAGSLIAAGSVVTEGMEIPSGVLAAGAPATVRKEISGRAAEWIQTAADEYRAMRLRYMSSSRRLA